MHSLITPVITGRLMKMFLSRSVIDRFLRFMRSADVHGYNVNVSFFCICCSFLNDLVMCVSAGKFVLLLLID
jgi:hypothetical protein